MPTSGSSPMFGPFRGRAPTHNTTTMRLPSPYEHIAALGGLRGRKSDVPPDVNAFWENQNFHNFADYAMSEDFHSGLIRLRELGHDRQCAIMCAEALWWRCHRRIIADYLIAAGETVFHILGPGQIEQAHMTEAATPAACGVFTYPAKV